MGAKFTVGFDFCNKSMENGVLNLVIQKIVVFIVLCCSMAAKAQLCLPSVEQQSVISECDYCQCSQGISPFETGSTGIRLEGRSLYRGASYNGSKIQKNPNNHYESYFTSQLIANYRASESPFTFSAIIPYVVRQAHDPPVNVTGEGISDVTAIARYHHKFYVDEAMVGYSFSAGVKFPTGSISITNSIGDTLDPHIRPGTGTTDLIIGSAGIWSLGRTGISASVAAGFITGRGAARSRRVTELYQQISVNRIFRSRSELEAKHIPKKPKTDKRRLLPENRSFILHPD
jgi:hypothetical protein